MKILILLFLCNGLFAQELQRDMVVTTSWLSQHLHDPSLVLLCVQESSDFCSEHIPGSQVLDLSEITVSRQGIPNELPPAEQLRERFRGLGITPESHIVLYGERLGVLAARAYWTLDYLGLGDHAALLDGGLEAWRYEKRPTDHVRVAGKGRGSIAAETHSQVLINVGQLKKALGSPSLMLLDARPEEEFSGQRRSLDVATAGHIPGARSLYWQRLLLSPQYPVFRSEDELRLLFASVRADDTSSVVTYCRTGMQSSVLYFVAKYLGFTVSMYDGSFLEWSAEGLPTESARPGSSEE